MSREPVRRPISHHRLASWLLLLGGSGLSIGWACWQLQAEALTPPRGCGLVLLAIYGCALLAIAACSLLSALVNAWALSRQTTPPSRIRRWEPWLLALPLLLVLLWLLALAIWG